MGPQFNKVFICSACKRINLKSRSISYRKELFNELCHFDVYSPFKFKKKFADKGLWKFHEHLSHLSKTDDNSNQFHDFHDNNKFDKVVY